MWFGAKFKTPKPQNPKTTFIEKIALNTFILHIFHIIFTELIIVHITRIIIALNTILLYLLIIERPLYNGKFRLIHGPRQRQSNKASFS